MAPSVVKSTETRGASIPKQANFQFNPNIDVRRNLHINVQISFTIKLILDQVESIKIKTSIYE